MVQVEAADPVIEIFERAVERYGCPEGVMTDRGSAFHSWKGLSRFEALLEDYEINYFLAREAAVKGYVAYCTSCVWSDFFFPRLTIFFLILFTVSLLGRS